MQKITEEKYDVSISSIGDRIIVKQQSEPCVTCAISLTSPSVKDDWQGTGNHAVLLYVLSYLKFPRQMTCVLTTKCAKHFFINLRV